MCVSYFSDTLSLVTCFQIPSLFTASNTVVFKEGQRNMEWIVNEFEGSDIIILIIIIVIIISIIIIIIIIYRIVHLVPKYSWHNA
jgi:uncharacterized BrkB/YihY/UPF0761 family membrane protein